MNATAPEIAAGVVVVVVLGVAAATKLRGRTALTAFAESLRVLVPRPIPLGVVAGAVVAAEAGAIVLTVLPATRALGLLVACVLFVGYALGVLVAVHSGLEVACRCFGDSARPLGRPEALRNGGLAVVTAFGLLSRDSPATGPGAALVAATAGAIVAVAVVRWDDLVFLLSGAARPGSRSR